MNRLVIAILIGFLALPVFGQQGPGGGGPGGGQGGFAGQGGQRGFGGQNGRQITPAMIQQFMAQAQQRQLANIKDQLQCSDDEFAALQPYLEKVLQLQTTLQINQFSGRRFGGQNIATLLNGAAPPSDVQSATADLQAALNDDNTPSQIIAVKLQALRDAKTKAAADLKAARDTLRVLCKLRWEAVLVVTGILD